MDHPAPGEHAEHKEECDPKDVGTQPEHHLRQLIAKKADERGCGVPAAVMQGGMGACIGAFEIFALVAVGSAPARPRELVREQTVIIDDLVGVRRIAGATASQTARARIRCRPPRGAIARVRGQMCVAIVVDEQRASSQIADAHVIGAEY